ncbi:MAG: hypothetical protein HC837_06165 [Chloroflexaceae bacterium]|nr:hypothetical protein [Chloroflexaceae bacterium]
MRIGVIATMKKGLEQFIYRELTFFTAQGLSVSLFPTKFNPGLYNPRPEWQLYRWHPLLVLLLQPIFFFSHRSGISNCCAKRFDFAH